jgi:hypothetical protein
MAVMCKHFRASQLNAVRADLIQRLQVGVEWFQEGGCLGMAVLLVLNEGLQEQQKKRYSFSNLKGTCVPLTSQHTSPHLKSFLADCENNETVVQ